MFEVTKALSKLQSDPQAPRPPIMTENMLEMRKKCDLEGSEKYFVMCAIASTFWEDIKRLGNLLSSQEDAARGWNPYFRLHSDRIDIFANRKGGHNILINQCIPRLIPQECIGTTISSSQGRRASFSI